METGRSQYDADETAASIWIYAGDFLQGFIEIQNGRHESTLKFFVDAKTKV